MSIMVVNLYFVFGVAGVARLRDEVLKGLNSGEPSYVLPLFWRDHSVTVGVFVEKFVEFLLGPRL